MSMELPRINKFIASAGKCSRRKAEELILMGQVQMNGEVVRELGIRVSPSDIVVVNGETLVGEDKVYFVFNKPRACVTTVQDPEGRPTVLDYFQEIHQRVFPVGRLDYLSEGLLVLTNDGDLAQELIHPRHKICKVYEVKIFGRPSPALLEQLQKGIVDKGELLRPKSVRILEFLPHKTWLQIVLEEGRNREIRRLCEKLGLVVDKLRRVRMGGLSIDDLKIAPGRYIRMPKKKLLDLVHSTKQKTLHPLKKGIAFSHKKFEKEMKEEKALSFADPRLEKFKKKHYQRTMQSKKSFTKPSNYRTAQKMDVSHHGHGKTHH